MSRHQARKMVRGDELQRKMAAAGIYVHTGSQAGLAEEAGLCRKVVRFIPIGNVKG